jgi:hypothetical protein
VDKQVLLAQQAGCLPAHEPHVAAAAPLSDAAADTMVIEDVDLISAQKKNQGNDSDGAAAAEVAEAENIGSLPNLFSQKKLCYAKELLAKPGTKGLV